MLGIIPQILLIGIRLYRTAAGVFGMRSPCRFYPSCSVYGEQAIQNLGVIRGVRMIANRLLRCHPWNPGGVDLPRVSLDSRR